MFAYIAIVVLKTEHLIMLLLQSQGKNDRQMKAEKNENTNENRKNETNGSLVKLF